MVKNLHAFSCLIILCCVGTIANAQIDFNYMDPNENFYVTQKRFNNYFDKYLKKNGQIKTGAKDKLGSEEEEELRGFELYKRWEDFMAPRVYPSGNKTEASRAYEEYQKYLLQNAAQQQGGGGKYGGSNSTQSNVWKCIGPFGDLNNANAGRCNTVRFDPVNPNSLWVNTPDGGLWNTTNKGNTFYNTTDNLSVIGTSDVCFDPTNAQIIYLAMGDADAGDSYSSGVLKSTNGGATWNPTGLAWTVNQGRTIPRLLINPLNKNEIWAATSVGLYRTTNAGANWSLAFGGGTSFKDIEYKPGDTTTIYLCASGNFYQSTNSGTTFNTITSGLPTAGSCNRLAIAVTPANPNVVYVVGSASSNSGFYGFYQSTNSGTSFTQKATTPNLLGWASAGNDAGGQGWYTLSIAASPTNSLEVVVGGVNIWRTLNGGTNWALFAHWTASGAPYVHADIHDLVYKNGTTLYECSDGGLFYTTNGGTSQASLNGNMAIAEIYRMCGSGSTYSMAITGHQDNGTNKFTGNWNGSMGGDGMDCFIDRTNDNVMYGEQYNGSFNRSTNGGANWAGITSGLTGSGAWVTPWHQDPQVANTIYGGRQEMFKSTNQGTNWAQIGTMGGGGQVVEFAVAPSNPQYIYVIKGNTLYKTTNGGGTWSNTTGTLPTGSAQMTNLAIEEVDPNSVWVTFSGYSTGNKVYKTIDGGATWVNYSTGLPNLPTNCIVYQSGTKDVVYVGCDVGVYYRDSLAASWTAYNTGLPNVSVRDLDIFYPLGKLRAATFGRSVWEADLFNPGTLAPKANFYADKVFVCPGGTSNFFDLSTFGPTSWSWTFQGGTPATSTAQNPSVIYNTAGTYSVALTATNANGNSSMTKLLYITVTPTTNLPLVEGFQGTFPQVNWQNFDSGTDAMVWKKCTWTGKGSTNCMVYDNLNWNTPNTYDEMRTTKLNLTTFSTVKMTMDVAYARYDPTYSDSLAVLVSSDCGVTYNQVYLKGGTTLATAPDLTTSGFTPTAVQWRSDTVNLSAYAGMGNVMVSFQNRGHYGQYLYLDIIAAFSTPTAICAGQSIVITDLSTNVPTSWSWTLTGGSPPSSSVKNPTVTYVSPGTYTITLISTNGFGSSPPLSKTITVNPLPTVTIAATSQTICSGKTTTLTGSGASTYTWNTGATSAAIAVTPTTSTAYTVTGTSAAGCSNTSTINVTVNALPSVTATSSSGTQCAGKTNTLTGSGATSYTWNTGATTTAIVVTPTVTTTYTVTGANAAGCTNTAVSTISVNPLPVVTITANPTSICSGGTSTLTAFTSGAAGATWLWSTTATTSVITSNVAGAFTATITDVNGCVSSGSFTLGTSTSLSLTASSSQPTFCTGNTATLTVTGATSFTWNTGATTSSIVVTPTTNTTYSVLGSNGSCTGTTNISITINSNPTISAVTSQSVICTLPFQETSTLTASGANTYTWNPGGGTGSSVPVSPTVTTNYTVVGTAANGCTASFVITQSVTTCLLTQELNTYNGIIVFPNPNDGEFTVRFTKVTENVRIEVYNTLGQLVVREKVNNLNMIVNLGKVADGVYHLRVLEGTTVLKQEKIMKQ